MEREEQFRRNLKHAFEFIEGLIDFPEQLAKLPDGAHVVSMPADDPELCTANEDMMRVARGRAQSPHRASQKLALDDTTLLVNV